MSKKVARKKYSPLAKESMSFKKKRQFTKIIRTQPHLPNFNAFVSNKLVKGADHNS